MAPRNNERPVPALADDEPRLDQPSGRGVDLDAISLPASASEIQLLAELDKARKRLDYASDLMEWALDYGAMIDAHGAWLDVELMRSEAEAYKCAVGVAMFASSARRWERRQ
jgi:hypothetical protein